MTTLLDQELADTVLASRGPLATRVARRHPDLYARIRAACTGAPGVDVDEHAARICRDVLDARRVTRVPYGHLKSPTLQEVRT